MKELVWNRQLLPAVERNATRPFLTDTGTGATTTYGEHGARVLRLANALRKELGVEPGDRVAVMSLNSASFEELYHAGLLGACVINMIVTGGENVYSTEVEQALAAHPAVAQAAVIGIPDDTWGEAVHAVVVLEPEHDIGEDELIEHTRGLIAGYKVPKSVEFRAEPLPLSGAMKVLERELRAPYWEGKQRGVN